MTEQPARFDPLGFAAPVLLVVAHFAPWAQHKTAALTQSAHDLAVSTHFTPGAGNFLNQWFYAPVWVAALLLVMAAPVRGARARMCAGLVALFIAAFGLPEYPKYFDTGNSLQFAATALVCAVILLMVLLPAVFQSPKPRSAIQLALLLIAAVPLAGYLSIQPALVELYRDGVGIGSGWWLTLVGSANHSARRLIRRQCRIDRREVRTAQLRGLKQIEERHSFAAGLAASQSEQRRIAPHDSLVGVEQRVSIGKLIEQPTSLNDRARQRSLVAAQKHSRIRRFAESFQSLLDRFGGHDIELAAELLGQRRDAIQPPAKQQNLRHRCHRRHSPHAIRKVSGLYTPRDTAKQFP